jgi:hypothetical protein
LPWSNGKIFYYSLFLGVNFYGSLWSHRNSIRPKNPFNLYLMEKIGLTQNILVLGVNFGLFWGHPRTRCVFYFTNRAIRSANRSRSDKCFFLRILKISLILRNLLVSTKMTYELCPTFGPTHAIVVVVVHFQFFVLVSLASSHR